MKKYCPAVEADVEIKGGECQLTMGFGTDRHPCSYSKSQDCMLAWEKQTEGVQAK
jgi:hypothetical protein